MVFTGGMRYVGLVLVATLGLPACGGARSFTIDSSRPVRIIDDGPGCLICERTPCEHTISRETCRFFDSSSGHVLIRAVLPDLQSKIIVLVTCDIEEGQRVFFDFEQGETELSEVDEYLKRTGGIRQRCRETTE
jgi:hypothetical protein